MKRVQGVDSDISGLQPEVRGARPRGRIEYHREYYQAHKEKMKAQTMAWQKAHPERMREIWAASRKRHPDRMALFLKRHPDYFREWRRKMKRHRSSVQTERPPRSERAYQYRQRVKLAALEKYGGKPPKCSCCGELEIEFLTLDHVNNDGAIRRKSRRGTTGSTAYRQALKNDEEGIVVMCWNCNCGRDNRKDKTCPHKVRESAAVAQMAERQFRKLEDASSNLVSGFMDGWPNQERRRTRNAVVPSKHSGGSNPPPSVRRLSLKGGRPPEEGKIGSSSLPAGIGREANQQRRLSDTQEIGGAAPPTPMCRGSSEAERSPVKRVREGASPSLGVDGWPSQVRRGGANPVFRKEVAGSNPAPSVASGQGSHAAGRRPAEPGATPGDVLR